MSHDPGDDPPLPANLRFLKTLVTVLTATMIAGLLTIIVLLVIRLGPGGESALPLPDEISLPQGARALSVAWGPDHYVVVTDDDRVLIFDMSGELLKTVEIQ